MQVEKAVANIKEQGDLRFSLKTDDAFPLVLNIAQKK